MARFPHLPLFAAAACLAASPAAFAAAKISKGHSPDDQNFALDPVPPPAINDAAAKAAFTLIDGQADPNSAGLEALSDGKIPGGDDQPGSNFFFVTGSNGGRIGIDLGEATGISSVATYSWHRGNRAPQVYKLYAADGKAKNFDAAPKRDLNPVKAGWTLLADVDTRSRRNNRRGGGGQHAVEISGESNRELGKFRHLLFDIERSGEDDPHGNTFFSEIDVIASSGPAVERLKPLEKIVKSYASKDGKYRYIIDSTRAPALTEWSEKELIPVIEEWYPKLVEMLPSDGYRAPDVVHFEYRDDMGGTPAYAAGNRIAMSTTWFPRELEREAKGCVVHEMGHVVQNYWRARQTNREPKPNPGWIVEGICDYIRWFLYEPESRGAEIRNPDQARYDASYRVSANFIDWVVRKKDKDLLQKLNAAAREGRYEEKLWQEWTGKTVQELAEDWKADIAKAARRRR